MSSTTESGEKKGGRKRPLPEAEGEIDESNSGVEADEELEQYDISAGSGRIIRILTDPLSKKYTYNVGNSIWGASFELVNFLKDYRADFRGSAVEIGAGTGAPGLVLWSQGARVTLTDQKQTLPFMNMNIALNTTSRAYKKEKPRSSDIVAMALDWKDHDSAEAVLDARGPFDLICGAEVSYNTSLHNPLVDTLLILMGNRNLRPSKGAECGASSPSDVQGHSTEVLLAVPLRDEDGDLIDLAASKGLSATLATTYPPSPEHESKVAIYSLRLDN
mmetsp:Transcript_37475/g.81586  ORF Transcript_37475/g.81586 Transcript_37475/m.81586 type:complete len:275 (-) Transcript_37475:26-850(-)